MDFCYYCGQISDTVDHVLPQSVEQALANSGLTTTIQSELVSCCRECNCLLGNRPPWTKYARKQKIKTMLRKRYKKLLASPNWTEEELLELGHELKSSVLALQAEKALVKRRIAF
jgi:NMD protein affecting ribosome stability and mRNA decay